MKCPLPGGFGVLRATLLEMSSVTHTHTKFMLIRLSKLHEFKSLVNAK